ncbi:hypothetical protein QFZ54_003059 [Sphingomonas faeni]|nr:hypothetical protein [Sphingomonas faeni]
MRGSFVATAACAMTCAAAVAMATPGADEVGRVHAELWPETTLRQSEAAIEMRVALMLERMSLEQKVGQTIQGDIASTTPEDVATYHLGSILNGGSSSPGGDEFGPASSWLAAADAYYAASMRPNGKLPRIPVMWGSDAVHGHNNIVGATLFPHNIGLGAARDPALIERIGAATAQELRVTGLDWTFAPTIAVARDDRWGGRTRASRKTRPSSPPTPRATSRDFRAGAGRGIGCATATSSPRQSISSPTEGPPAGATEGMLMPMRRLSSVSTRRPTWPRSTPASNR